MVKETAWGWIDHNQKRIIEVADTIWGYAELGLNEMKSSKLLQDELRKHGFKVEAGVAGMPTAFVATWGVESLSSGLWASSTLSQESVIRLSLRRRHSRRGRRVTAVATTSMEPVV